MVATTSGSYRNSASYAASKVLDKNVNTFYVSGWFYNWLQLDLGASTIVHTVIVTKRSRYALRFRNVEVHRSNLSLDTQSYISLFFRNQFRVGNTDVKGSSGRAKLTKNVVCAAFGSAKSETTSKIPCSKPMSGRYVTLQPKANDYLMIAEVNILMLSRS